MEILQNLQILSNIFLSNHHYVSVWPPECWGPKKSLFWCLGILKKTIGSLLMRQSCQFLPQQPTGGRNLTEVDDTDVVNCSRSQIEEALQQLTVSLHCIGSRQTICELLQTAHFTLHLFNWENNNSSKALKAISLSWNNISLGHWSWSRERN